MRWRSGKTNSWVRLVVETKADSGPKLRAVFLGRNTSVNSSLRTLMKVAAAMY